MSEIEKELVESVIDDLTHIADAIRAMTKQVDLTQKLLNQHIDRYEGGVRALLPDLENLDSRISALERGYDDE